MATDGSTIDGMDVDQVLSAERTSELERTITPVLMVGIGGTGAAVLRRVKARAKMIGVEKYCRFLIIDMDSNSQNPEGKLLPGFEPHEFLFLPNKPANDVLRHPELHPELSARLDLEGNPDELAAIRATSTRAGLKGAGQVRPLGILGLWSNFGMFYNRLDEAIQDLTGKWNSLTTRLGADNPDLVRMNGEISTYLVSSICGGTGSSLLIDVAVIINQKLQAMGSQITAVLTMPDVYEKALRANIGEWPRVQANAYATLMEIDFFQSGQAHQAGVVLGSHEGMTFEAPPAIFQQTYLVERKDHQGRDLKTDDAVYDTIALHMIAEAGSTLGGKLAMQQGNNMAAAGLVKCPRSGKPRIYSTMGASALTIPIRRILMYCSYRRGLAYVEEKLLGIPPTTDLVDQEVDTWLNASRMEERASKQSDQIIDEIRKLAVPDMNAYASRLYKSENPKEYYPDREFIKQYDARAQKWESAERPALKAEIGKKSQALQGKFNRMMEAWLSQLITGKGLNWANAAGGRLNKIFSDTAKELTAEALTHKSRADGFRSQAERRIKPLRTFIGKFGTDRPAQDEVAGYFRNAAAEDAAADIKLSASSLLDFLATRVKDFLQALQGKIDKCQQIKVQLSREKNDHEPRSRELAGDSQADLDVTSEAFVKEFYEQNSITHDEITAQIENKSGKALIDILQSPVTTATLHDMIFRAALGGFGKPVSAINVVDVIMGELRRGGEYSQVAQARFDEGIKACRPMWKASIGIANAKFSDSVMIGLPVMDRKLNDFMQSELGKAIPGIQNELNNDVAYQARISTYSTNDPYRIYAIRRSHGGLPFYLENWPGYSESYRKWMKNPHHPIHIFPQQIIDSIPPIEPMGGESAELKLAFALGMAFGLIIIQGKFYYYNLQVTGDAKNPVYEVLYNSQWDCIPFTNGKLREPLGMLAKLVKAEILKFQQLETRRDPARKLGETGGRKEAFNVFKKSSYNRAIMELFEEIREMVGFDDLSKELKAYVTGVSSSLDPKADNYQYLREDMALLQDFLNKIRPARG